jgi:hypothetical protein
MAELVYKMFDGDNVYTYHSLTSAAEGVRAYVDEHPERLNFVRMSEYVYTQKHGAKVVASHEGTELLAYLDSVVLDDEEFDEF